MLFLSTEEIRSSMDQHGSLGTYYLYLKARAASR